MQTKFNYRVTFPSRADFGNGQMESREFINAKVDALDYYVRIQNAVDNAYRHLVTMQIQRVDVWDWEEVTE